MDILKLPSRDVLWQPKENMVLSFSVGTGETQRTEASISWEGKGDTERAYSVDEEALRSSILVVMVLDPKWCVRTAPEVWTQALAGGGDIISCDSSVLSLSWGTRADLSQGNGLIICVCKPGGRASHLVGWNLEVKFCPGLHPCNPHCWWCSAFSIATRSQSVELPRFVKITHAQIPQDNMKAKFGRRSCLHCICREGLWQPQQSCWGVREIRIRP